MKKDRAEIGRALMSGNVLTSAEFHKILPYVIFIALLMFLYIANGYHTQKLYRQYGKLNAQVKELRTKSLSVTEMRMTATRQSEIMRRLEENGINLIESVTPPVVTK